MGKRANKRQKTEKTAPAEVQPLGTRNEAALLDDANKDDEERHLESMLFGTKYVPGPAGEHVLVLSDDEEEQGALEGEAEFHTVMDTDLFFVDDAADKEAVNRPESDVAVDIEENVDEEEHESDEDESEDEGDQVDVDDVNDDEARFLDNSGAVRPGSSRKAPAWTDPDDADLSVSLASTKRLRKLRDTLVEDNVTGKDYERKLRRQFHKINPTPEWATKARTQLHPMKQKRRRLSHSSDGDSQLEDDFPNLLSSTGGILGPKSPTVQQGILSIERLRDANLSARAEGAVKAVQFHPSSQVPVMLTASEDRRLRLFNVDGHTNPHLQTIHIPDLPMTNAMFHPTGSSVLLTGPRPYFYTYDLQSGTYQRSPRGLWGTTFNGSEMKDGSMEICAFDTTGEVLAVAGRRGYVHLVDWRSGAGQVVGSVKMNSGVKGVWWSRGSGRSELMSLGEDSEVYVWDVGEKRCVRRWKDDGGYGSHLISGDRSGQYLGIGSRHGIVNVYGSKATFAPAAERPKPLKSISNLTTSITAMKFNADSQLLALASNVKKDQMRMVHLPSLTVFSNWPTSGTPLGHVTSVDFSTGSEYVAVGNSRGRVLLYHLLDFAPRS